MTEEERAQRIADLQFIEDTLRRLSEKLKNLAYQMAREQRDMTAHGIDTEGGRRLTDSSEAEFERIIAEHHTVVTLLRTHEAADVVNWLREQFAEESDSDDRDI